MIAEARAAASWSADERRVALQGGLEPDGPLDERPLVAARAEHDHLVRTGVDSAEAAQALGVSLAAVRRRVRRSTLIGVRHGGRWRLPAFQFHGGRELPGWAIVCRALPRASLIAVARWIERPHSDLCTGDDEQPTSPRQWLLEGRPAEPVALLASEIA